MAQGRRELAQHLERTVLEFVDGMLRLPARRFAQRRRSDGKSTHSAVHVQRQRLEERRSEVEPDYAVGPVHGHDRSRSASGPG